MVDYMMRILFRKKNPKTRKRGCSRISIRINTGNYSNPFLEHSLYVSASHVVFKQVMKKSMRHTPHESGPLGLGDDVGWGWIKRADDERKRQCAPPHNNLSEQRRCLFSTTHWQSNRAERQHRRNWVLYNLLWIFSPKDLKWTELFFFHARR